MTSANERTQLPLHRITVVEAGAYFAAPLAAMMLADLGAAVIKVEPPRGDPFRRYGLRHDGLSAAWVNVNHGKQCRAIDLRDDAGQAAMHELLAAADVFVNNWRPAVAGALGLAPDDLARRHPELIQLSLSGFGSTGPRRDQPAFDGVVQAVTGFAAHEARPGEPPRMSRAFLMDKTVAVFASQAVLAALVDRERTGRGAMLEMSMLDVMAYFNFPDNGQARTFLPPADASDLPAGRSAILETADGHVLVAPVSGAQIKSAFAAVGRPDLTRGLREIASPTELMDTILDRLETATTTMTTAACEAAFAAADVPACAVLDFDSHLADPQTVHNESYFEDHLGAVPIRRVRHPLRVDGARLAAPPAAQAEPSSSSCRVR